MFGSHHLQRLGLCFPQLVSLYDSGLGWATQQVLGDREARGSGGHDSSLVRVPREDASVPAVTELLEPVRARDAAGTISPPGPSRTSPLVILLPGPSAKSTDVFCRSPHRLV